jgi:endoglucanase
MLDRLSTRYRELSSALVTRYRNLTAPARVACILVPVLVTALAVTLSGAFTSTPIGSSPPKYKDTVAAPLKASGANLVDDSGKTVALTGVNWFGFETETFSPHGLWARNWESMLDQMKESGFNTLRLPYTNEMFWPESKVTQINYRKNPDLKGLHGIDLMEKIVNGATDRGLMVLLDRHRPTAQSQSDLWYTPEVSEKQWIDDWTMLARTFKNNPLVIGADLHNEPKATATWGSGDEKTDWQLAAERAGNAILKENPNWLIVVEGIETFDKNYYWWGGNLMGARDHPVRLSDQSKLVYSAHDYGPGVWKQKWFSAADFPQNLPEIWKKHWAYLKINGTAPVLMGEFGGRSVSPSTTEGKWQRALVAFLKENGMSYTYWTWNPNSGDTGGVLKDDWKTVDKAKLDLLKTYQAPGVEPPVDLSDKS